MIRWRGISSILAVVLAGASSALARVEPVAAVTSTVIEDAVVVLNLPYAEASGWEEEEARYYDWNNGYSYGGGYRLPRSGRAQYISGFGGGNQSAVVTSDGGCAVKSATGAVWCFGRNSLDGDGTRRDIPVPRLVPGIEASAIEYVSENHYSYLHYYPAEGPTQTDGTSFNFNGICALSEAGAVKCWGQVGSESVLTPTTVSVDHGNVAQLFPDGALTSDGELLTWDRSIADGSGLVTLKQIGVMPEVSTLSDVKLVRSHFQKEYQRTRHNYGESWPRPEVREYSYVRPLFGKLNGNLVALSGWDNEPLATQFASRFTDAGELEHEVLLSDPELASGFSPLGLVEIRNLEVVSEPISSSQIQCVRDGGQVLCERGSTESGSGIDGSVTSEESGLEVYYWSQYREVVVPAFENRFVLPADAEVGSDKTVATPAWACSIRSTGTVDCGPVAWYATPDPAGEQWVYMSDAFIRNDRNLDGRLSVGTELPINCGVGFQCDFDAEKLSVVGDFVTAIGTLTRTPRTSVTVGGAVAFDDGTVVSGGTVSWRSSDGLLSSSATIQPNGSFSLPARSGDGRISFGVNYGDYVGCPAAWSEVDVLDMEQPACVTQLESATIDVALTGSLTGRQVTLPTVVGESRTISLRFGDGETPIAGVRLSGSAQGECVITEAVGLGGLYACPSFHIGNYEGERPTLKTGADGTATIWMPTGEDIALTASMIEADGITWSDTLDSFYDDGPNPDPYLFPGLIVAETPAPMTIMRGQLATIDSAVLVDGIDPAYGLNAALEPVDSVNSTCASSDELQDTSDESGEVTFTACPSGSGEWRVVSTDGSFFPSAPFEITVTSPPMVSSISLRGATLDETFTSSVFSYEGYFTGSSVRFTVRLESAARRARVTTPRCSRPVSGVRSCTVSVALNGVTDVYTFNLRRNP